MAFIFYTSVGKGLKLKVRKFWGLIPTFVEVAGEKLRGGPFCPPSSPPTIILFWVKMNSSKFTYTFSHALLCKRRLLDFIFKDKFLCCF